MREIGRHRYVRLLQVVTEEFQVGETRHHAEERGQVQIVVERHGSCDGTNEQRDDAARPALHVHVVRIDRRFVVPYRERHQ